MLNVFSKN